MSRAVMQQALEALEVMWRHFSSARLGEYTATDYATRNAAYAAIYQLRAALAEPEQPVGINGLTEAETDASASVMGLVGKPEPVAWRTFDGEGGYDYRAFDDNEDYATEWAKRNPRHIGWVEPLYTATPQPEQEHDTDCHLQAVCQRSGYSIANTPRRLVELTDEEIGFLWKRHTAQYNPYDDDGLGFARAVIAAYEKKQGEQT